MKKISILSIMILSVLLLAWCSTDTNSIQCTIQQKEAEVCSMDYTPVCGDDGETYSNACGACSTEGIDSYVEGECNAKFCDAEETEVCEIPEPVEG